MNNKETLEKLRTYQIGVIRSVIASRQGRMGTYQADAIDRERLADTDGLAYEEYYESPLTIEHDGLCRNVISLEFCEDGLTPVCLMNGGDDFPLPLENLSCDTLQGIVEWLEEYDFIPSAEAAPQTTSDLTADFVECSLPEYPTRYDVFRLGELQNFLDGHESPEFGLNRDEAAAERDRLQLRIYAEAITAFMKRQSAALPGNVSLRDYAEALVDIAYEAGRRKFFPFSQTASALRFHIMLFQQFIKRGLWIKNLSTKSSIRDLAVVPVILQGAFRDAEDAANLLTGQVQFISDGRAVRVDQNIDSPDGFDDVAVQFLERGAVAGDDLFGHATGFLSDSFPGDAGCRRPGTVLYSLMLYKG